MPEGAECRIIADQLTSLLAGHKLLDVEVLSGRYARHGDPKGLAEFKALLPLSVQHVSCKGKFIYFQLMGYDAGIKTVWNTLGMTGHWSRTRDEHARVVFKTTVGDLYFYDPRNFGTLSFGHSAIELQAKLDSLGLDLLKTDHTFVEFKARLLKRRKKTIVEALMDQSIMAGVGNYVKCEALWHSEISPHRVTGSLSDDELGRLLENIKHVVRSAYRAKGHTMSDFRDLEGHQGDFKFKLAVYRRVIDDDGNLVAREETKDGRTTHWSPTRQR